MRSLRPTCALICLCTAPLLTACHGAPDTDNAVLIDSYDADGRSDTGMSRLESHDGREPVIIQFAAGDEISTVLLVNAPSLLESSPDGRVRVLRPFELMASSGGFFIREPGGDFERPHGSLDAGLGLSDETRTNDVTLTLTLDED